MLCHGRVTPVLYEFACYTPPGLGTAQVLQRLAHTGHLLAKFIMMKLRTVATVKSIVQFDSFDVVDALSEMLPVRCERFAF